jgi:uncharacterized phiE125 gp8 family phage protein
MSSFLIEGPKAEPVTVEELRDWLRLDGSDQDTILARLITAGRMALEHAIQRRIMAERWRVTLNAWPKACIVPLPISPVQSIVAVRVYDSSGQPQVLTSDLYRLSRCGLIPRLKLEGDVPKPGIRESGIEIDVVAGYGATPDDVPGPLRMALRLLVTRWHENRGDADPGPLPADVMALVAPYRRMRLA